jgi:hypothetical protein
MQRFEIDLPTIISWRDNNIKENHTTLTTSNICSGGAYFSTRRPLDVSTQVALYIQLPFDADNNGHRPKVKMSGIVIYTNEQGMGIKFDNSYQFWPDSGRQDKR